MELLGDFSQIEVCFGLFGDSANLHTRWGHSMELHGDVGQLEARFGLFGDGVNHGTR
jgi:hypothetical protein